MNKVGEGNQLACVNILLNEMFSSSPSVGTLDLMQCDVWDRTASEEQHKLSQQQVMVRIIIVIQKQGQTILVANE